MIWSILSLFVEVMYCVFTIYCRLSLLSAMSSASLTLLIRSLLHYEFLYPLFLFPKILVLKLECIYGFKREIECILLFEHFSLRLCCLLEFVVAFLPFPYNLIDVHVRTNRTDLVVFLLHNGCSPMQKDFLVFFLR